MLALTTWGGTLGGTPTVSSLLSFPRHSGHGSGAGPENARTVQPRHSRPRSVSSGPNSCYSCRCSSCSKRSASCRMTSPSCCRSESSWSAAVLPLNGSSGNSGRGWRRPSGRYARWAPTGRLKESRSADALQTWPRGHVEGVPFLVFLGWGFPCASVGSHSCNLAPT